MKDSNQFHAVCLDTYPPCVYLNDVSHSVIDIVHKYNNVHGGVRVSGALSANWTTNWICAHFRSHTPSMLVQMLVSTCSRRKLHSSCPSSTSSIQTTQRHPRNIIEAFRFSWKLWKMRWVQFYGISEPSVKLSQCPLQDIKKLGVTVPIEKNVFKYIIHAKLGDGPKRLDNGETLLTEDGQPIRLAPESDSRPRQ